MKVIVSNIQRFCLHDGPGIRTTVFLKGCNLRCPWCSNPENISFEIQEYVDDGIIGKYGKEYSLEELENIILKDEAYYRNDGGVTFSGGECLLQFEKIEPLLINLKNRGINICVETALNVPSKFVDTALKYVDKFYIDLKILDENNEKIIGSNHALYKSNLQTITNQTNNIVLRLPVIPNYTYTTKNIDEITKLLKEIKINEMEIFTIHRLGEKKYNTFGLTMPKFKSISKEDMDKIKNEFQKYVNFVKIIQISL